MGIRLVVFGGSVDLQENNYGNSRAIYFKD